MYYANYALLRNLYSELGVGVNKESLQTEYENERLSFHIVLFAAYLIS